MSVYEYDVALSFAGEDRGIVEQLANRLLQHDVRVFYDSFERAELWGKDLYEHLASIYSEQARYCVIFISENYANKLWTTHERRNAQARAFKENQEYILPIRLDQTRIPGISETIGYLDLESTSLDEIVSAILTKLGKAQVHTDPVTHPPAAGKQSPIYMPQLKRKFGQKAKDDFLKQGFIRIKEYFAEALKLLENQHPEVETDFTEVHNFKFLCSVYQDGAARSQCKIWLGGLSGPDAIGYSSGSMNIDNDNSYNEMLSVADDGQAVFFRAMMFGISGQSINENMSIQEAAEYLWRKFIDEMPRINSY